MPVVNCRASAPGPSRFADFPRPNRRTTPVSASALDPEVLATLVPLNALKAEPRADLLKKASVTTVPRGKTLFQAGEDARTAYYVLQGEVHLLDVHGKPLARVVGGEASAAHRLAHQSPRKVSARCATDAEILAVDAGLMDVMLTWDQTGSFEVGDLDSAASDDWMSRLLQMRSFQMVPPAHLQTMFMRLQPVTVDAGTVVVRQGDEGDYFYVVMAGRCIVTREQVAGKPVRLAELESGSCFGEEALISDDRRNATVTALVETRLMRLAKTDFRTLLTEPLARKLKLAEAEGLVARGEARWLDVRLPSEFATGSLPGAINLPLNILRMRLNALPSNTQWIVCCDSGRRSAVAVFVLTQKGYTAMVLDGGVPSVNL